VGLAILLNSPAEPGGPAKPALTQFTNKRYQYTLEYPLGWRRLTALDDHFEIANFLASKSVPGVVIPPGGALIIVMVPEELAHQPGQMARNLEDFVRLATSHQNVIGKRGLEMETERGRRSVIEVRTNCCVDPVISEYVSWYFSVDDQMFCVTLGYRVGDKKADELLATMQRVALSIRGTSPTIER
jgi:hypothetical protein